MSAKSLDGQDSELFPVGMRGWRGVAVVEGAGWFARHGWSLSRGWVLISASGRERTAVGGALRRGHSGRSLVSMEGTGVPGARHASRLLAGEQGSGGRAARAGIGAAP